MAKVTSARRIISSRTKNWGKEERCSQHWSSFLPHFYSTLGASRHVSAHVQEVLFLPVLAFISFLLFCEEYLFFSYNYNPRADQLSSNFFLFFPLCFYPLCPLSSMCIMNRQYHLLNQWRSFSISLLKQLSKTSKLNHVSLEFGAWSFLQAKGYFRVEEGNGRGWEEPCTDGEKRRSNHDLNSYLSTTLGAYANHN